MDERTRAEYEEKSLQLKVELKEWENEWVKAHGEKPRREAIKANPEIEDKYKQYNKVRATLSGKTAPPTKDDSQRRKRKPEPLPAETPIKKNKHLETPSKERMDDQGFMGTPIIPGRLFSPAAVSTLGPTPQRDGRVLGLFDLLVERELGTPSKKNNEDASKNTQNNKIHATPSKRSITSDDDKLGRTPMSSSKRHMLNSFMTPLKDRSKTIGAVTPSRSVSKLQFDTPAFLKRHSLPALDENGEFDAPAPLKLPRKPLGRGLSEIVASLRKVEEEALDEDEEAMREAEAEEMGLPPKPKPKPTPLTQDEILAKDIEVQNLPLGGFDDEGLYDSLEEGEKGRDGQPLRVFKKKGQKRTTRKVNMRPVRSKRPANVPEAHHESSDELGDDIPESGTGGDDSDFAAHGGSESEEEGKLSTKKAARPAKKEGTVKKTVRKVNELAHANFQRLKLRNNGAKGGPGFNSRFRRRR